MEPVLRRRLPTFHKIASVAILVASIVAGTVPSAASAPKMKRLGLDPALDAPPAVDLTYLDVGRNGNDLEIRVGLNAMIPVQNSYPEAGIEWAFYTRGRTFVAEGHPDPASSHFTLYEIVGGNFVQLSILKGSFDWTQGYMTVFVPLSEIGATKGTVISGMGPKGTQDVDVHQHAGPVSPAVDSMATVRDFVVP